MGICSLPICNEPYPIEMIGQNCTREYTMLICPHCGKTNAGGMSTCVFCGKSLQNAISVNFTCNGTIVTDQPRQVDERYVAWQNS